MNRMDNFDEAVKQAQTAVIYARFSSQNQKEISIEGQIRECRKYADRFGFNVVGEYCDRAKSATTDNRPEFQRMIADAKRKKFKAILCWKTDRFARNRYDASLYKKELKKIGVRVYYCMESFTDNASGMLQEGIAEVLDEFYSMNLSENVKRGYYDSGKKHLMLGTRSLGYRRGPDGKHQIDEDEAAVVRRVYNEYESGKKIADILRDLNKDGFRTTHGREFTRNSLRTILRNPAYIGTYILGDQICDENVIPPIISKEQFMKVQKSLETRKRSRCSHEDQTVYILTTKLFCGLCGEPMTGESATSKSGQIYYYYTCVNNRRHRCKKKREPKDRIEELVAQAVVDTLMDDEFVENMLTLFEEYQDSLQDSSEVEAMKSNLRSVQTKKKNLLNAIEAGIVTDTTLVRMQELEQQEKDIERSLQTYTYKDMRIPQEVVRAFFAQMRTGDIKESRFRERLIDVFVEKVFVWDDHFTIAFRMSGREETITLDDVRISGVSPQATTRIRTRFARRIFCLVEFVK